MSSTTHESCCLQQNAAAIAREHIMSFEARGRCMWPSIRPGDRLFVRALDRAPRVGQIVVYLCGDRVVAHRVVMVIEAPQPLVRCRGDAAHAVDQLVPIQTLLGFVDHVERRGRDVPLPAAPSTVSRVVARGRLLELAAVARARLHVR